MCASTRKNAIGKHIWIVKKTFVLHEASVSYLLLPSSMHYIIPTVFVCFPLSPLSGLVLLMKGLSTAEVSGCGRQ
jgi:hypothetical protein